MCTLHFRCVHHGRRTMCEQLMNIPLNPAVPFCLQLNEIADIGVRASVTLGQIDSTTALVYIYVGYTFLRAR